MPGAATERASPNAARRSRTVSRGQRSRNASERLGSIGCRFIARHAGAAPAADLRSHPPTGSRGAARRSRLGRRRRFGHANRCAGRASRPTPPWGQSASRRPREAMTMKLHLLFIGRLEDALGWVFRPPAAGRYPRLGQDASRSVRRRDQLNATRTCLLPRRTSTIINTLLCTPFTSAAQGIVLVDISRRHDSL